jgi:hypothetical protein
LEGVYEKADQPDPLGGAGGLATDGFSQDRSDTATATFNPPQCNFAGVGTVCGQNITNTNNHVDVVRLGLGYKF